MERSHFLVVIPAFNEETTVAGVVKTASLHCDVLVVDDCSPDSTAKVALEAGAFVETNARNMQYEGTLQKGFEYAHLNGYSIVITMDADGEHNPNLVQHFIQKFMSDEGLSLICGERQRKNRFSEHVAGKILGFWLGVKDPLCGMKAYKLVLWEENGGFDSGRFAGMELATRAVKRGHRFTSIPVDGEERSDAPRYGKALNANLKILAATSRLCFKLAFQTKGTQK